MGQVTRTAFSFMFFMVTVFVSMVTVQGGWSNMFVSDDRYQVEPNGVSWVSQNFDPNVAKVMYRLIAKHQQASYTYLLMASHFNRADVALPGFAKYFRSASDRQLDLVDTLAKYVTRRGEYMGFRNIKKPDATSWDTGLDAMEAFLETERHINGQQLELHRMAGIAHDPHLTSTLEDVLLDANVDLIKDVGDKVSILRRMVGPDYGLAEYIFDKSL